MNGPVKSDLSVPHRPRPARLLPAALLFVCWSYATLGADLPATFTLQERFGVAHPQQPVEFTFAGGTVDPAEARMIGPAGVEVPFQQLASGNILVQTRLPNSLRSQSWFFWRYPDWDPATRLTVDMPFASSPVVDGTPARLYALQLPPAMASPPLFFLKNVPGTDNTKLELHRSPALDDPIVMPDNQWISGYVQTSGWVVDPRDATGDTLYSAAHAFLTGDPVRLSARGTLPAPLQDSVICYVIRLTGQTFRLATSHAGALAGTSIDLTDAGSGVFEAIVDWTWRLEAASPSGVAPANAVVIADGGDHLDITNGLTGIRVIKPEGNGAPYHKAPIQAVRFGNGTWSQAGPNYLYEAPQTGVPRTSELPLDFATGYSLTVLEAGPLAVRVRATYGLDRPEMSSGAWIYLSGIDAEHDTLTVSPGGYSPVIYNWMPGRQLTLAVHANGGTLPGGFQERRLYYPVFHSYDPALDMVTLKLSESENGPPVDITSTFTGSPYLIETQLAPGPGSFTETITLYAGQKSILIDDEADSPVEYFLNFRAPGFFVPDVARYRPHTVHSQDCGYEVANGQPVPYSGRSSAVDVFLDLDAATEKDANDCSCSERTFACLALWNMPNSGQNTGWYWLFYDNDAASDAPLIGFYQGRLSRLYRVINTGPGMYASPSHFNAGGAPATGIDMPFHFRGHDLRSTQRTRREWGLYVSTKAELRPTDQAQAIAEERNSLTGLNLTHQAAVGFEYPDPPAGWPPPYMDRAAYARLVEQIQSFQIPVHWMLREFSRMWIGQLCVYPPGPCAGTADDVEYLLNRVEQMVALWQQILVHGSGPFDPWWTGYQPGTQIMYMWPRVLAILDYPNATPQQKARAKAAAAWLASVYWDNDYVPLDIDTGDGLGNANQAVQMYQYRFTSSLALTSHPAMAPHREEAISGAEDGLDYLEPSSGAPRGSCHYHTAGMDSVLSSFLLLKNQGVSMAGYPQWLRYGDWMLDALSPPDPRFGSTRKIVSVGDGATKGIAMLGMVAALVRETDPERAARLQWGWWSQFNDVTADIKVHEQSPVPSVLVIDEQAPQTPPPFASRHYEGYWSVLRSGALTPFETGAWFVNGNWYSDHRHEDGGQVSLYAHTAPLATDWNAHWWNPHTPGGYMHNRVNLEADLDKPWDADDASLSTGTPHFTWPAKRAVGFTGLPHSAQSSASHGPASLFAWTRTVRLMAPDPRLPVVWVTDAFQGPGADDPKVLTWNLWAQGAVDTPAGAYTPLVRFNTTQNTSVNAYPSNGPVHGLGSGPQRFRFTGHDWPSHETGGIDFDLYLVPDGSQEFFIGNWGHNSVFGSEAPEFRAANNGLEPEERQHILRVRGSGSFTTVLLPYRKGERPADLVVSQDGADYVIGWAGKTLRFNPHYAYYTAPDSGWMFTAYDATGGTASSAGAAGGPLELARAGTTLTITAHGPAGPRTFTAPDTWTLPDGVTRTGPGAYSLHYAGGEPRTWVLTAPNPVPIISALRPPEIHAGRGAFRLSASGSEFVTGATLFWNGSPRPTTVASGTEVQAAIDAGDVAAVGTANIVVQNPAPDLGPSTPAVFSITGSVPSFTDHPLTARTTMVKAAHFTELRARIDVLRGRYGLPAFGWTDPALTGQSTLIRGVHLSELRTALTDACVAAGEPAPSFSDPVPGTGTTAVAAVHLMELRAIVARMW
jgi:hypothetical protein